jgi:hypothetical protein
LAVLNRIHGPINAFRILFIGFQPLLLLRLVIRYYAILVDFTSIVVHKLDKSLVGSRLVSVLLLHKPKHYLEVHPRSVSVFGIRTHSKVLVEVDTIVALQCLFVQQLLKWRENNLLHIFVGTGIFIMLILRCGFFRLTRILFRNRQLFRLIVYVLVLFFYVRHLQHSLIRLH